MNEIKFESSDWCCRIWCRNRLTSIIIESRFRKRKKHFLCVFSRNRSSEDKLVLGTLNIVYTRPHAVRRFQKMLASCNENDAWRHSILEPFSNLRTYY